MRKYFALKKQILSCIVCDKTNIQLSDFGTPLHTPMNTFRDENWKLALLINLDLISFVLNKIK